jgi:hypothetical protein
VKGRFPTVSSKGTRERRGSEKCRKRDGKCPKVEPKNDLAVLWILARLGSVLEAFWSVLEVSSSVLKPSWKRLGAVLQRLGGVLERIGAVLEASWSVLEAS